MKFRLVDIVCTSKSIKYVFSNDGTFQLTVKGQRQDYGLFEPNGLYSIKIRHEISDEQMRTLHRNWSANTTVFSRLGVVIRLTRNSTHIASGTTIWTFPRQICSLRPGIDVWITVSEKIE